MTRHGIRHWVRADPWRAACLALLLGLCTLGAIVWARSVQRTLAELQVTVETHTRAIQDMAGWINAQIAAASGTTATTPAGTTPPQEEP